MKKRGNFLSKNLTLTWLLLLLISVAVLWAGLTLPGPIPPRKVIMTTGPEGSAYYEFGLRYQKILAREGITLELQSSNGAMENLERLRDPESGVMVGFMQGGITNEKESPNLVSLGTLFYEPLWIFYRGPEPFTSIEVINRRRYSIGPEGSGTRALALQLLALAGITEDKVKLLGLPPKEAGEALLKGEIDVAVMVNSWDSPIVPRLLASETVEVKNLPNANAYVALLPFLSELVVPEGIGDMAKHRPPSDVILVAPEASLVAREDLHPAIQYLLLAAAHRIHSRPGIFKRPRQFPAPESIDLHLSSSAIQYYQSGPPFLQRYLPFWMAVLAARALFIVIPFLALLYPILRSAPFLYDWRVQRRISKLYGDLKSLEKDLEGQDFGPSRTHLFQRLDEMEQRASKLKIPSFYSHMPYTLREHIRFVRDRLQRQQADQDKPPAG